MPKIRTAYSKHERLYTPVGEESLTEQHHNHKDALSTKNIVKRYIKTGVADHLNARQPLQDALNDSDMSFHDMLNIVAIGQQTFEALPAKVRAAFNHDAAQYLDAFEDASKRPILEELGLIEPLPQAQEKTPPVASDEPPKED